jgi:hypothetical protein
MRWMAAAPVGMAEGLDASVLLVASTLTRGNWVLQKRVGNLDVASTSLAVTGCYRSEWGSLGLDLDLGWRRGHLGALGVQPLRGLQKSGLTSCCYVGRTDVRAKGSVDN